MSKNRRKNYGKVRSRVIQHAYRSVFPNGQSKKLVEKSAELLEHWGVEHDSKTSSVSIKDRAYKEASGRDLKRVAKKSNIKEKKKDDFYVSWAWQKVRYEALSRHGRRCMCCGWEPAHGGRNYLCVDHIKPRKGYPELALDIENLQVLCNNCNMGKSNLHHDDFRQAEGDDESEIDNFNPRTQCTED